MRTVEQLSGLLDVLVEIVLREHCETAERAARGTEGGEHHVDQSECTRPTEEGPSGGG